MLLFSSKFYLCLKFQHLKKKLFLTVIKSIFHNIVVTHKSNKCHTNYFKSFILNLYLSGNCIILFKSQTDPLKLF